MTRKRSWHFARRHFRAIWPELFFWARFKGVPDAGESARNNAKLCWRHALRCLSKARGVVTL